MASNNISNNTSNNTSNNGDLSPTTARKYLIMYQIEQTALKYLEDAVMYENNKNFTKAEDLYEKASKLGNMEAKYKLGLLYSHSLIPGKNKTDALPLWLEASFSHKNARYELGLLLETGDPKNGVPQNPEGAFHMFLEGTTHGHSLSFHAVGYCYWV